MKVESLLKKRVNQVNRYLDKLLPATNISPRRLHSAMRYSVFSGGKRIRPILAIESCLCCGGSFRDIIAYACALELVHTFSLIHDDLPSMDNDDFRRGKPSCHKKYDEATAILAGDALLALCFDIISSQDDKVTSGLIAKEVSKACGSQGMVGGQMLDLQAQAQNLNIGRSVSVRKRELINQIKTAALIRSAVVIGAISAGATDYQKLRLSRFGEKIGLAFQLVDDILDKEFIDGSSSRSFCLKKAQRLTESAKKELGIFGGKADTLCAIADLLVLRSF